MFEMAKPVLAVTFCTADLTSLQTSTNYISLKLKNKSVSCAEQDSTHGRGDGLVFLPVGFV